MRTEYTPTHKDVLRLIASMSAAQLSLWYEIGKNIQGAPIADDAEAAPTAEELAAEDALWDAAFARHADKFEALAAQAVADIEAGRTLPMFDEDGRWLVDDYTEADFERAAAP